MWDVDLQDEEVVAKYARESPDTPQVFGRGQEADAEPATPGWKMPVDALFSLKRVGN